VPEPGELIDAFCDQVWLQDGLAASSLASYRRDLVQWAAWLERRGRSLLAAQRADVDAFLAEQFRAKAKATSVARRLSALRRFYALQLQQGTLRADPTLRVRAPKLPRRLPKNLSEADVEALLAVPDTATTLGLRDRAMLETLYATGLRVSELCGLTCGDVQLGSGAHIRCTGKGRRQRSTPLTRSTANVLTAWMRERAGQPGDPLFPTSRGRALSRDAVALLVTKYAAIAAQTCPALRAKPVSPHTLRHTCAMNLLRSGADPAVIALCLGHANLRSVERYIHADMRIKERALARTTPIGSRPRRYRPPDRLMAFLEALGSDYAEES
jgi:site-specific recombinase XerD